MVAMHAAVAWRLPINVRNRALPNPGARASRFGIGFMAPTHVQSLERSQLFSIGTPTKFPYSVQLPS